MCECESVVCEAAHRGSNGARHQFTVSSHQRSESRLERLYHGANFTCKPQFFASTFCDAPPAAITQAVYSVTPAPTANAIHPAGQLLRTVPWPRQLLRTVPRPLTGLSASPFASRNAALGPSPTVRRSSSLSRSAWVCVQRSCEQRACMRGAYAGPIAHCEPQLFVVLYSRLRAYVLQLNRPKQNQPSAQPQHRRQV